MGAYKNYGGETSERPTILCPCPAPRRLLTSTNWICRNDSSNINAILHPDHLNSPRLKYGEKTKGEVIEKNILGRNNCYCRCKNVKNKKIPRPSFFKKPNTCISYEGTTKTITAENEDDLKRESYLGCVCDDSYDDLNVPEVQEPLRSRLLRLRESKSAPGKVQGLRLSDQRERYGEYREIQREKFETEVQKYRERERGAMTSDQEGGGDVSTILGTQKYGTGTSTSRWGGTTTTMSNHNNEYYENFDSSEDFPQYSEQTVPDFRREHYFETHDIGKMSKMTDTGNVSKDHICIHQFKLDKRWLPEPVSKDSFGRSLCKICYRPMEGSNISLGSGYLFSENGLSRSKLKSFSEAYQSGIIPKNVNFCRGKSKIELLIKESDIAGFYSHVNRAKCPIYCNSLALRQQKMRLV